MTNQLFDSEKFMQSLANDRELAAELLGAFFEDCPVRKTSLGEALEAGDAAGAAKFAHSIKGMCGVVRGNSLVDLALAMENAAKDGNLEKATTLYATFEPMLDEALAEMRAFIA